MLTWTRGSKIRIAYNYRLFEPIVTKLAQIGYGMVSDMLINIKVRHIVTWPFWHKSEAQTEKMFIFGIIICTFFQKLIGGQRFFYSIIWLAVFFIILAIHHVELPVSVVKLFTLSCSFMANLCFCFSGPWKDKSRIWFVHYLHKSNSNQNRELIILFQSVLSWLGHKLHL